MKKTLPYLLAVLVLMMASCEEKQNKNTGNTYLEEYETGIFSDFGGMLTVILITGIVCLIVGIIVCEWYPGLWTIDS